jgi:hypothetical protein
VDWIHLAQDRDQWQAVVNTVMYLRVPYNAGNFLSSWVTISLSMITLLHGVNWLVDELVSVYVRVAWNHA